MSGKGRNYQFGRGHANGWNRRKGASEKEKHDIFGDRELYYRLRCPAICLRYLMSSSRSVSGSKVGGKRGHLLLRPSSYRFRTAHQCAKPRFSHIVNRSHGLTEIRPNL
jgi:hypothetical protein